MAPTHQLIQNQAKRPHIRLHTRLAGNKLLRRHVTDSATARGVGGSHRCVPGESRFRGVEACVLGAQPASQAEVENLHQAAVCQHHVLRLQVAVKDAQRVRRLQAVRNLNADGKNKLQTRGTARNEPVERLARHILHHDVAFVAALAYFINRADVGVLNRRSQPRLAQHRRAQLLGREQSRAQYLQHHRALQQRVRGQVHHAAAACSQPARNLVMFNRSSCHLYL